MSLTMPQTYLIGLCILLLIISILVGKQLFKVRRNEIDLVKLEKGGINSSKDPAKLYELASIQIKKRLFTQATLTLKRARKLLEDQPSEAKALIENALGFSLAAQDNFKASITHYKLALKAKPDYPVALNNLAFAKQKLQQTDEALELYEKSLKIDPSNETANKQLEKLRRRKGLPKKKLTKTKGF